jgi:hypothetical protein
MQKMMEKDLTLATLFKIVNKGSGGKVKIIIEI